MATSTLNPNAPIFVPSAYREVEDFSDQWWDLVQSSPWFRDYWLRECFSDPQATDHYFSKIPDLTLADEIDNENSSVKDSVSKDETMDLVSMGWLKWRKPRGGVGIPMYCEKAPRIVKLKMNPRPIQQPR